MTELATLGIQVADDARRGRRDRRARRSRPTRTRTGEVLRHRDFDRMTAAELRDAERLVDLLRPRLERRRTRRYELHPHGRRLAPRAMFRRNLATGASSPSGSGGARSASRARSSSCATSRARWSATRGSCCGSSRRSPRTNEVRTESFVFGTRLTRVTRLHARPRPRPRARPGRRLGQRLGGRDADRGVVPRVQPAAGRGGRCGRSGIVIVVSDGWDRGDPALVAAETARLRRNCHRLVWLNPLARPPGYQPLAAGMRAAYPVHRRLPAGRDARLASSGSARSSPASAPGNRAPGRRRHACDDASRRRSACMRPSADAAARRRRRRARTRTAAAPAPLTDAGGHGDEGAARHARRLARRGRRASAAPSSSGRSARAPRPEGAVLLVTDDGRIAGSVSGGCVEGAAAEEIERARKTGRARVIRYGISDEQAWDVGLACGGTIDVLSSRAVPDGGGRGGARDERGPRRRARRSSRRCPRTRRRPSSARTSRATGAPPAPPLVVHDDGRLDGTLGDAGARRRSSSTAARDALAARRRRARSSSAAASCSSRRSRSGRGSSSSARSRSPARSSGSPGSSATRRSSSTAGRRSRRRGAVPRRRPADRRLAGRGRRRDRPRAGRRGRGPDPRREVRRAGDRRGAPPRLPLRRRGRLDARPRPTAARGCARPASRRGGARAAARPDRARPRRAAPAETALAIMAEIVAERYGGSGRPMRELAREREAAAAAAGLTMRVAGLVLAAGAATRFGSPKQLAPLDGRPILEHVLDALAAGRDRRRRRRPRRGGGRDRGGDRLARRAASGQPATRRTAWRARSGSGSRPRPRTRPSTPSLVVLGDQPRVRPEVIARAPRRRATTTDRPIVGPRYSATAPRTRSSCGAPAWRSPTRLDGDRGLGPLLARAPGARPRGRASRARTRTSTRRPTSRALERHRRRMPDAPTYRERDDDPRTAAELEAAWAERASAPTASRSSAFREAQGSDFYAPVSSLFVADPRRTGEPALDALARARRAERDAGSTSAPARAATPCRSRSASARSSRSSRRRRCAARSGPAWTSTASTTSGSSPGAWPDAARRARRAAGRGRRADRPRRLRHRGDRPVPRRDGARRPATAASRC